uniref:(Myosin heavy-chain) kinase n=1 Tax=Tetraselmis sp. GSL018 TaxID=582737 RepID=A0A061S7C5_9CHLO
MGCGASIAARKGSSQPPATAPSQPQSQATGLRSQRKPDAEEDAAEHKDLTADIPSPSFDDSVIQKSDSDDSSVFERKSRQFGRIPDTDASKFAWPDQGNEASVRSDQPSPSSRRGKPTLKQQKSYIPLDDLYVFQSTLGDLPSNIADDLLDEDEARLLKEAKDAGLDYTNPDHVRQILFSAVSLSLLLDFAEKVGDEDATTYAILETVIKPSSAEKQCSYAELLDVENVGRAHYFVCHSWGGKFMHMVRRIKSELHSENPDYVFLWIDVFALNWHVKDRTAFGRVQDAMLLSKRGTLAVLEPTALITSCCLYELWATVNMRGLRFLKMAQDNPAPPEEWDTAVREVDILSCKSTKQRDKGAVLEAVSSGPGEETFNQEIRVLLTLEPPHFHNAILTMNQPWTEHVKLEILEDWMDDPERMGKTLWIRGPNGTGKSTVYAAILSRLEKAPGGALSSGQGFRNTPVLSHAVSFNDTKTRDPTRILLSLAWQLFQAFPEEVGDYYANLGSEFVCDLDDMTTAVKVLLKDPIKDHIPNRPILLMLDGLDEGTGDIVSLTTAGMSNYDDQMLTDINLCWENLVLRFVCVHLRSIARNVSLVVTSRSSSLEAGEEDYLQHMLSGFGSHSLSVESVDNFFAKDGNAPDLSNSGPLRHLSQRLRNSMSMNSSIMSAYSQKNLNPWASTFPTMVYARVAKEIESIGKGAKVPQSVPEAMYKCLQLLTKKMLSVNGIARLVRLLEVLAAIREPPTLSQLRIWGFKDVKRLVKACGFMLFVSETGEVHAFHKILFKFLADQKQAGEFFASPRSGHKSLARMLANNIADPSEATTRYALRNVMLHAHLADDLSAIDALAGSVNFWRQAYKARVGNMVYQDMLRFGRMSDTLKDTALFLSRHQDEFMRSPELVVQRAFDTPKRSIFAITLRQAGVRVRPSLDGKKSSTSFLKRRSSFLQLTGITVPGRVVTKPAIWSPEQFTIVNPDGVIWGTDLSPDGMILALGTGDHRVVLHEAQSGIRLAALEGHTEAVNCVTYSCDGTRIASAACDETIRLWDAGGGVRTATLRGHDGPVTSCSFSPCGSSLASGGIDGTVRLWALTENGPFMPSDPMEGHTAWVASVAYSPCGQMVVSGGNDGLVIVWDPAAKAMRATVQRDLGPVYSVCFSPDSSLIAVGCGDGVARLRSADSFDLLAELQGHRDRVECVNFSPDGTALVTSSRDAKIRVFNIETEEPITVLEGHRGAVHHVRFSLDGLRLYSGSADKTARVWGINTKATSPSLMHERLEHHFGSIRSLAFGPSSNILASASDDCLVKVFDADNEVLLCVCEGHLGPVFCVAVSPDGALVVSGSHDNTVRIWDSHTGNERGTFEGHTSRIYDVQFTPDGRWVASASYDMTVALWDPYTGVEHGRLQGHLGSVTSIAFSVDGARAVTASNDHTCKLWDMTGLRELSAINDHNGTPTCVAASPDGMTLCTGSNLGLVQLWDLHTLTPTLTLRAASKEKKRTEKQEGTARTEMDEEEIFSTMAVAFSPEGTLLAAGLTDKVVRVYDVTTGSEVAAFVGHSGSVRAVAFSPDGRLLASGADDMFVRLWELLSI